MTTSSRASCAKRRRRKPIRSCARSCGRNTGITRRTRADRAAIRFASWSYAHESLHRTRRPGRGRFRRSRAASLTKPGRRRASMRFRPRRKFPQDQLLDVAVKLFDENTPKDEKKLEKEHIFPEVRKAEARYFPMQIRNTLEGTGHWGQVRVIPADADALDVQVSGKIIESNGQLLRIDIAVVDATGRLWFKREYQQTADTRSYKDQSGQPRDPFQNLYSTLANDMLAYRQQLPGADLRERAPRFRAALREGSRAVRVPAVPHRGQEEGHVPGRAPAGGRRSAAGAHGPHPRARLRAARHGQRALLAVRREHGGAVHELAALQLRRARGRGRSEALGADAQAPRRRGDRRRPGRRLQRRTLMPGRLRPPARFLAARMRSRAASTRARK